MLHVLNKREVIVTGAPTERRSGRAERQRGAVVACAQAHQRKGLKLAVSGACSTAGAPYTCRKRCCTNYGVAKACGALERRNTQAGQLVNEAQR